jgi:hypothetical protein
VSSASVDGEYLLSEVKRLARLLEKDLNAKLNEATTQAKYIQPLLEALGWQLSAERLVLEYPVKGTSVDLALLSKGKAVAFVEAKRLRENLSLKDKEADQALQYGYHAGINWCILTNGELYKVYDAFAKVDHEKKLIASFSVTKAAQDPDGELGKVRLLSYEAVTSGELGHYAKQVFAEDRVRELLQDPSPAVVAALAEGLQQYGVAERDVRAALQSVVGGAVAPPAKPTEPTASTEAEGPEQGPASYVPPLRLTGDRLSMQKQQRGSEQQVTRNVPVATLREVAQVVASYRSDGRLFSTAQIRRGVPSVTWKRVADGLGAMWLAGLLEYIKGDMPAFYRLREPLDADGIVKRVLACAEGSDK